MSRFGGDDWDEAFPGQWALWQANFDRHMVGRQGQRALANLRDALLALPEPRLIPGRLADEVGGVCTVGALAVHLRVQKGEERQAVLDELASKLTQDTTDWDSWEAEELTVTEAIRVGLKRMLAQELAYRNDQAGRSDETPEQRYSRVLAWVESKLIPVTA